MCVRIVDRIGVLFVVERHEKTPFYKGFAWVRCGVGIWCKLFEGVCVGFYCNNMPLLHYFCKVYAVRIDPKIVHSTWKNPNP